MTTEKRETVIHHVGRGDGCMAVRSACATAGDAGDRISQRPVARRGGNGR
jgi:hypothetical protein